MVRCMLIPLLLSAACGGESTETTSKPTDQPVATAAERGTTIKFDPATLRAEAVRIALVPSPAEMQKALSNAGLTSQLAQMVDVRDIKMTGNNKDQTAVRAGVVLADIVLTIKASDDVAQLTRLARLKQGFVALGADESVSRVIDDLSGRIRSGSGSKDDLVKEMDQLAGVMVPELKFTEGGEGLIPLIQAGSWLEGAYLVSGAIQAEGKFEEARNLLKQPAVVDYFLGYVKKEGKERAPDAVVDTLEKTLTTLKEIAAKDDLTEEDVNIIHSATGAVLKLL